MDMKKISFGFNKTVKQSTLRPLKKSPEDVNKVELIKCVEGKEIKLVEEKKKEIPLVIPIGNSNGKTSLALQDLIKKRNSILDKDKGQKTETIVNKQQNDYPNRNISCGTDSLDERAARELLAELEDKQESEKLNELTLPLANADNLPLNGAKESSLDDYNSIPIEQFGFAMLRGMGWVDPPKTEKSSVPIDDSIIVRPKGMGLGADKALQKKSLLVTPEPNDILTIKRNAYVCILGGKYKDFYGQIEGFDDYAGRVIVKMAIGGNKEAFSEFLCQPVPRKEYTEYGKCLNKTKYEEFNKLEHECKQVAVKKEKPNIKKENSQKLDNYSVGHVQNFKLKDESCYIVDVEKKDKETLTNITSNTKSHKNDYDYKQSCSSNTTISKLDSRRDRRARSPRAHDCHKYSHHRRKRRYTSSSSSTSSESSYDEKRESNCKSNRKSIRRDHKKSTSSSSSSSSDSNRKKHRSHRKKSRHSHKRHRKSKHKGKK